MTLQILSAILGWSTLINMGMLTFWFLMFVFAHQQIYQLHSRWFKLSLAEFDSIMYKGLAFYKISIFLLNLTPFLALQIVV